MRSMTGLKGLIGDLDPVNLFRLGSALLLWCLSLGGGAMAAIPPQPSDWYVGIGGFNGTYQTAKDACDAATVFVYEHSSDADRALAPFFGVGELIVGGNGFGAAQFLKAMEFGLGCGLWHQGRCHARQTAKPAVRHAHATSKLRKTQPIPRAFQPPLR